MTDVTLQSLFPIILTMSISGGVPALMLFALKPFLRDRAPKAVQYYLWLIVIAQFILPLSVSLSVTSVPVLAENAGQISNYEARFPQYDRPVYTVRDALDRYVFSTEEEPGHMANVTSQTEPGPAVIDKAQSPMPVKFINAMTLFWLLGFILFLSRNVMSYFTFSRRVSRNLITTEIHAKRSGRRFPVYKSRMVKTPMLIGLRRAKIILPDRDYEPYELQNILRHEMVHFCRHDLAVKWLVTIANAVHWFNPIAYLVRREMNLACELSCDAAVIKDMDANARQSYGDTLISVVADGRYPVGFVSTTMCEDKKKLKERLVSIMKHKKSTKTAILLSAVLAVVIIASGVVLGARSFIKDEPIQLGSIVLSDIQTDAVMAKILTAANAKSGDIIIGEGQELHLTGDYKWDFTSVLPIYVSMDEKGGQPYARYQMEIQSETSDIDLFKKSPDVPPSPSIRLSTLLDALKYLPTEYLDDFFDTSPDKFIVKVGLEYGDDALSRIFYNRGGVTENHGYSIRLDLLPSYGDGNGGYTGQRGNVVQLFYSETYAPVSIGVQDGDNPDKNRDELLARLPGGETSPSSTREAGFYGQSLTEERGQGALSIQITFPGRYTAWTSAYLKLAQEEEQKVLSFCKQATALNKHAPSAGCFTLGAVIELDNKLYWLCSDGTMRQGKNVLQPPSGGVEYINELVRDRTGIDMLAFSFDSFSNLTKAHMSYPVYQENEQGDREFSHMVEQTVEDADSLRHIERIFTHAESQFGAPACPFLITLELTKADGTVTKLLLAADSCDSAFTMEGLFLDYNERPALKRIFDQIPFEY